MTPHTPSGRGVKGDAALGVARAWRAGSGRATRSAVDRDAAHWQAVEEATELLEEHRFVEALTLLRDVLRADRENPYAYHYVGVALYESGELQAARDAYEAAVRLSPEYLGARVGLSHVLRRLGDARGALREARAALARFPNDGEASLAAGLAEAALGNRKQARRDLGAFLERGPELEASLEVRQILEMLGVGGEDEPVTFDDELVRKIRGD